jgi:phosphoglycerate dehydrogenase-like enzyme
MASDRDRPLVVLTDHSIRPEAIDRLAATCALRILDDYPSEDALAEASRPAIAILARLGIVTAGVIEAAPRLRIIARHGAGSDGVDLAAATARGIVVTTTGPANAGAVAEYTIALLLGLLRKIPQADAGMRAGSWSRAPLVGMALDGRTLGIMGYGAVGRRVAQIAGAFGMHVLVAASRRRDAAPKPVSVLPLHDMLARADVVAVCLRLTPETAGILDVHAIAALRHGRLAGAALDTYAVEPLAAASPLRRMPNVLLSPHVAGQTTDALIRVGIAAAESILDEFAGRRPAYVVNPEAYAMRAPS